MLTVDFSNAPVQVEQYAQGLAHDAAHDVRYLRRGHDGDPAVLHVGPAVVVLEVAVLDGGGVIPALHLDEARLLNGLRVVPVADLGVGQDVIGVLLVELRGAGLHGLLHIQHKGILLVAHLPQPGGLSGSHLVLRHHRSHLIAVVAHMAVHQQPVCHVLVVGVGAPGVPRRGEGNVGYVKAGEDLHHSGDLLRLPGIDGCDHTVGHGGVDQAHHQGAAVAQIIGIFCPAGGLFKGVYPLYTLAYALAHRASASLFVVMGHPETAPPIVYFTKLLLL